MTLPSSTSLMQGTATIARSDAKPTKRGRTIADAMAGHPGERGGEHDRYCFVDVPRCPSCDSRELKYYKTITHPEPDWSVTRYARCGDCEHKFLVILQ